MQMTEFDKVLSDNLPFLWQANVSWENVMWCNFAKLYEWIIYDKPDF